MREREQKQFAAHVSLSVKGLNVKVSSLQLCLVEKTIHQESDRSLEKSALLKSLKIYLRYKVHGY